MTRKQQGRAPLPDDQESPAHGPDLATLGEIISGVERQQRRLREAMEKGAQLCSDEANSHRKRLDHLEHTLREVRAPLSNLWTSLGHIVQRLYGSEETNSPTAGDVQGSR